MAAQMAPALFLGSCVNFCVVTMCAAFVAALGSLIPQYPQIVIFLYFVAAPLLSLSFAFESFSVGIAFQVGARLHAAVSASSILALMLAGGLLLKQFGPH